MSYSPDTYTGDNSTTDYTVSFPYLEQSHALVTLDGVEQTLDTDYSFLTSSTIRFDTAPGNGVAIVIARDTPTGALVDFADGQVLTETDLDKAALQPLYVAEENAYTISQVVAGAGNVPGPVNPTDDDKVLTASGGNYSWQERGTAFGMSVLDAANAAAGRAALSSQKDVITTRGDVVVGNSSPAASRLALGSAGKILRSDGSDLAYQYPAWEYLGTASVTSQASLDISPDAGADLDLTFSTDYVVYYFVLTNFLPAASQVMYIRTSNDAGSTYKSGASDYQYVGHGRKSNATDAGWASVSADAVNLMPSGAEPGTAAVNTIDGTLTVFNPANASTYTRMLCDLVFVDNNSFFDILNIAGMVDASEATTGLQLLFASGNIASGTVHAFGMRAAVT